MSKRRGTYRGTDARRRAIIDAALACFTEKGVLDTTMEDIRLRSGASNGSIYHHFKAKEQLAAAVYLEGILDYQAGLRAELLACPGAREGIRAIVRHHLGWMRDHADHARYLFRMRHADFMEQAEGPIAEANRELQRALGAFLSREVAAGALRPMAEELFQAQVFGPCHELARRALLGAARAVDLESAADDLADLAWQALRAEGVPPRQERDLATKSRAMRAREARRGRT
jgi:AcrR family transcriptional regulator